MNLKNSSVKSKTTNSSLSSTAIFKQSRFVVDVSEFGVFKLIAGNLPIRNGQLWKGETACGKKMEFAGNNDGFPTPYWDWSS